MTEGPTMVCFTDAVRRPPWKLRRGRIVIPLRQALAVAGGIVATLPLGLGAWSLLGSPRWLGIVAGFGAVAGLFVAGAQPHSGESFGRALLRSLAARRGTTIYRGRKVRVFVGLCPVPPAHIASGNPTQLLSSAVEVDLTRVGDRGELLDPPEAGR